MKIATGHQPLMPYLILQQAEKFIAFTQEVFHAKEIFKSYRDEDSHEIMHAEIQINGCNIMFADVTEGYGVANANLFVYVEDADVTMKRALKNGSEIVNEVADQDHGRSGGFKDPFGNVWWIMAMN